MHSTHHEWDGRRVILLPFREEQNELTEAVTALSPNEACQTVAFAHLAINKAITQRYVVKAGVDSRHATNSIEYPGLTGPDWFASLARTFTGHFHAHQTITQERFGGTGINLQGSVTYLGSPLQLSWADLHDEQRGVVLFDPETLEHELITNPHAIGYVATDLQQVLDDQVDIDTIADMHIMLIGNLNHLKYATARDKLLSLGVRSVRNWTPAGLFSKSLQPPSSLGFSIPASDVAIQICKKPAKNENCVAATTDEPLTSDATADPRVERLDLNAEVHEYVDSVDLGQFLLLNQDINAVTSNLLSLEKEEELTINHAVRLSEQSAQATRDQKKCEALQQQVAIKQSDAATYRHLVETEHSSLHTLRLEHNMLFTKLEELAANRELFVFWSSALSKRTRRASASSPSSTEKATANFRDHVLAKSMSELNGLLIQVLTVLYDDTRHAHIATGMLRSLFDSDSGNTASNSSRSGSVLDHALSVHPSLAYSKRSSGERKRIDLALFFALLQLVRARSAHRAHYALVDELFDNLDNAGQEAVTRWCCVMLQTTVGWVVVITHSQFLVDRDPGVDTSKVLIVNARMGKLGTELFVNDRKICGN